MDRWNPTVFLPSQKSLVLGLKLLEILVLAGVVSDKEPLIILALCFGKGLEIWIGVKGKVLTKNFNFLRTRLYTK